MTMPCKLVDESRAPVRFYDVGISAGFPSPAQDYEEPRLQLNDLLVKSPDTTFVTKANGDSMTGIRRDACRGQALGQATPYS